jgi:glutamate synthase domain-containing protein 3
MKIDAQGKHYRVLNHEIRESLARGKGTIELEGVRGQRYIGAGLGLEAMITIDGVPGNDLAAFMNGAEITVNGNAQDGVGNTMNAGKVVVHGHAGDVLGHSMRGGRIFVRGDAGYRVGIHMKSYEEQFPVVVVGGVVKDYAGEYMAGGLLVVLGLERPEDKPVAGRCLGTGMHGGRMLVRGEVAQWQLGREVGRALPLDEEDAELLAKTLAEYSVDMGLDVEGISSDEFAKLAPLSHRPYGKIYVY